jgi:hypothetical protein
MARQTELLDMLVQAQQHQFRSPQCGREEHPSAGYQDFFSMQPPLFHKLKNPLMQMPGSIPLSPSLHYSLPHAPKQTKLSSQPNSFVVLLAFGGTTTMPCNRMDMFLLGKNSRLPLGRTISRKDSLSESSMNFWHLLKKAALYFNTHRLSITCASTRAIMLTRMPRKGIDSVVD